MALDPNLPFSIFGTAPESPVDERDHEFARYLRPMSLSALPQEVGLENIEAHKFIGITNQMQEGSCTGHGARNTKTTMEVRKRKTRRGKRNVPHHSPRGIYHLAKTVGGYPEEEGAYMRDVVKALAHFGTPREKDWPYVAHTNDQGQSQNIGEPAKRWLTYAKNWKIGAYSKVVTPEQVMTFLHQVGPVFMAMSLHENFFNHDPEGIIPAPSGAEVGGHAMCILAADQNVKRYYVANSWSPGWGKDGFCWIAFDHFHDKVRGEAWAIHDA